MILGDSLVVMNSLLHYENLGGQVQMIYMDPPYGVKFGSNFQPFVRKRDVKHNDDDDFTREPEMVQAYRDTWQVGVHSYLTCLRDRLVLSRDLLTPEGSIFIQISNENVHHVRELMDDVLGSENFVCEITYKKTTSSSGHLLSTVGDYLLWYAKDISRVKYNQLYLAKRIGGDGAEQYSWIQLENRIRRRATDADLSSPPKGSQFFRLDQLTSQRPAQEGDLRNYKFDGKTFTPGKGTFKTDKNGMQALEHAGRLMAAGNTLCYVRYIDDFPAFPLVNLWEDTVTSGFSDPKRYVVQTHPLRWASTARSP
jgi:adenine-specific DNA-methyltransferase